MQVFADFFRRRFQLGIIESHELRKTGSQFGFWNPNLSAKECPHPIQPNLKDIPRKMFHKNVSFYFGLPILMFFSSSIAKLAIILDNLYWNLISALNYLPKIEKSCFEIRNVNKPLKYWCRKTFVMFQIFLNRGR